MTRPREPLNPSTNGLTRRRPLLVITAIVVLLAGVIVVQKYRHPHPRKLDAMIFPEIASIENAVVQFQIDCGRFPTSAEGLQALMSAPPDTPGWSGPYLSHFPRDRWEHPFIYRCPSQRFPQGFLVLSAGPDGIEGTDDDISNEMIDE